jgi:type I restriction enzyme M protein
LYPTLCSYVESKDNRDKVDITQLNVNISKTVQKIDRLRADFDAIVKEIENEE